MKHARGHARSRFRPQWRDLYCLQKREAKHLADATVFERAVFVFAQRERLGLRKPLSFRQAVSFIRNPGRLLDRIDAIHDRERRALAQIEKAETRTFTETIWTQHRAKADRLIRPPSGRRCATSTLSARAMSRSSIPRRHSRLSCIGSRPTIRLAAPLR